MTKQELLQAALSHPHPTPAALAEAFARQCAVENMGQRLIDLVTEPRPGSTPDLADVVPRAYNRFYHEMENDEQADGLNEERKSFLKDARRAARKVRDAGLPLTLANADLAWNEKAPFNA